MRKWLSIVNMKHYYNKYYTVTLAQLIVYSMAQDGARAPPSNTSTPLDTPNGATSTPCLHSDAGFGDNISVPLKQNDEMRPKSYAAGSKALDSLVKFIASCENFFHPNNSGYWTTSVSHTPSTHYLWTS